MNNQVLRLHFQRINKNKDMSDFKAIANRRLNALSPKEEQTYIDSRNLWKASTNQQEKQYQAVKNSGLLSKDRQITFLRFNYRYSEQKDLCYPQAYQNQFVKPKYNKSYRIKKMKKQKQNRELNEIQKKIKNQTINLDTDWMEQYHNLTTIKQKKQPDAQPSLPRSGTMTVCEFWGEKQLQESLGYLPCKRDRPKLLKLYSKKISAGKEVLMTKKYFTET